MYLRKSLVMVLTTILLILSSCSKNSIEYNGRQYQGQPNIYNTEELNEEFGHNLQSIGDEVDGMQVLLSNEGKEKIDKYNTVPTTLILKKNDDEYLVYSLQGGP